jgi:L-ascorbate metabolism protein UlaG (beta-lactamase superfamily)
MRLSCSEVVIYFSKEILKVEKPKELPMRITMIGHSTTLIEIGDQRILTDPYLRNSGNLGYRRIAPPARSVQDLTDVNLVLVSHEHWDHVDGAYFRALDAQIPIVTANSARWMLKLLGAKNLIGVHPWEKLQFGELTVTAVPAPHPAAAVGFVVQHGEEQVYFAGDTYYRPFMENIGQRFQLAVALIPVTTFRIPMTMGEKAAVEAVTVLKPEVVIPIHLGIQPRFPWLRTRQTPEGFARRAQQAGLEATVVILREGESWEVKQG